MCPIETSDLRQKAVLWAASGRSGDGEYTVSNPVEIDVRWERVKDQIRDSQSNMIAIDSRIVVDQEVAIGSVLWLGCIDDYDSTATDNEFEQVVAVPTIPDIKNRHYRRVLEVRRLGNTLPTIA